MALIPNERTKLIATYFNGLAIASAAVGGISQAVAIGTGTVQPGILGILAWLFISLLLHLAGQYVLGRLRE